MGQSPAEVVLHNFVPLSDGGLPYAGVIQGWDGALYGTTWGGGSKSAGTVFRLSADSSSYSVLHGFTNKPDGSTPFSTLLQGSDGILYGTTYYGGVSNAGTIFRIGTNGGDYRVLWSFTNSPDGANPRAGLIQGFEGALYGTTERGGTSGMGILFRIMPDGSAYSILHSFTNSPDGGLPFASLVQGIDGALYGSTSIGGDFAIGTVFTIKTNGQSYSVLHNFTYLPDGSSPESQLLQGPDGFLYGTTVSGGTNGDGTVFKLSTNGSTYARLYSFTNSPDGANPYYGAPVLGSDGFLYGTTANGGSTNSGTLYKLNPNGGGYAVVYNFGGVGDGAQPFGGLSGKGKGVFYGMTLNGGSDGFGTVYRLALSPTLQIAESGQSVQVLLRGFPGQSCWLQGTTNFTDWINVANLVLTDGAAQYIDDQSLPWRFYRAVLP